MQLRSILAIAIGISALTAVTAHAADKTTQAGNTGLSINNSPRMDLVTSVPIDYLNRAVANGRRVISLRVAQPLLCADFAAAPSVGVNPVAMQYLDPNGDSSGLLFAGISNFEYFTNGGASSLFKVTADAQLACCIMQPALNASCFQGSAGGPAGDGLFLNGFENVVAAAPETVTVDPVDLAVVVSGPGTVAPNGTFNYTIEVSNFGTNTVGNVVVRDWYPKTSGGFAATLGAGSWTCTPTGSASCGSANGTGNIGALAVSLGAGAKVTFAVSRPAAGSAPNGSAFSVSAAAFAPPSAAETALSNNQSALTATIQQTSYTVTPSTLTFSGVIGVPTATQNISVAAPGGNVGNVTISGCTFGGTAAADFSFSPAPTFPSAIAPGATVNLPVRMVASAVGSRAATVTCTTVNAPSQPTFVVTLNGTASDSLPTISNIGNQASLEDVASGSIAFTATDTESVLTPASLSCSSNNTALIDGAGCQFSGSEPNFNLVLTPKAHANGSATVTVTVTDGANQASDNFSYTVTAVNDAPEFTLSGDFTWNAGTTGTKIAQNFVTSIRRGPVLATDEATQTFLQRTVTLDSGGAIFSSTPSIQYEGSPETGTLAYGLNGTAGTAVVRVRMQDNGGTANGGDDDAEQTITITVLAPATGPSLSYNPATGATSGTGGPVNFTGVTTAGTTGTGFIGVTPSGGTAGGTSTLSAFTLDGVDAVHFAVTSATTLTFVQGTGTSQFVTMSCTSGVSPRNAQLQATESVQGSSPVQRHWLLICPAGAIAD